MRIVTLEEHISFPDMVNRISPVVRAEAGWPVENNPQSPVAQQEEQLREIELAPKGCG
ncbi:hypothetical protein [Hymenobacter terricola]|uniref:hypothetical protein n=1 Tax=Hymenobacter terricola TaxID=2819236 RepID=UPI001B307DD6|nr:hypothetical protein [Hymenobacter terricola]